VGGGSIPRPGELSLAHHGVLFLDELPEFSPRTFETLRQPVEQGVVHIARAAKTVSFPSQTMLVAAMNPCPCGLFGSQTRKCLCGPGIAERYQRRTSGPLLDRFDLRVELPAVPWADITSPEGAESTAVVRERVREARARQIARQARLNSGLEGRDLREHCYPRDPGGYGQLGRAVTKLGLSVRGVSRVLRVARTIADLEGGPAVLSRHVAEALHFRVPGLETAGAADYEIG